MRRFKKTYKKVVCGVLSVALLTSYSSVSEKNGSKSGINSVDADVVLSGDINCDGILSAADVVKLREYMLGMSNLDSQDFKNADINSDGKVNVVDCIMLISKFIDDKQNPSDAEKTIKLNGKSVSVTGAGMVTDGSVVTINEPGTYVITGKLDDGQIIVDVDKEKYPDGKVELSLENAEINCSDNSPVYVAGIGDECVISVKKGTENIISDGTDYVNADERSGAVYSKDDLKIKGKGKLTVKGNCTDGIVSKNDIKIFNGNIDVTAIDDGIRGKDSVKIGDSEDTDFSNLNVTVKTTYGDGIKSTNSTDDGKGNITINGGKIKVNSYGDAVSAERNVIINSGDLDIYTYTGSKASQSDLSTPPQGGGFPGMKEGNINKPDISAKGIKGAVGIEINGGTINIDSTDDSIHSNGDTVINGGEMTLASSDDGIHSDKMLTINDGKINIKNSYEGIEAYDIEVKGGNIRVVASDDGFNAAGGDGSGNANTNPWGQGGMSSSTGILNISGGYIYSEAGGDGIDSNGNITVSGGTVIVCGPVRGGNGIFDIGDGNGYKFSFTGGTVFGIGTQDMFVSPTAANGFLKGTSVALSSGTMVTVADSDGNVLSAIKVPQSINMTGAVVYASSKLDTGRHSVYLGGSYDGTLDENGYGEGGRITGASVAGTAGSSTDSGNPGRPG